MDRCGTDVVRMPAAPSFVTIAIGSGRSEGTDTVARTAFRATLAGVLPTVGKAVTSDDAATGTSNQSLAVFKPDLRTRRAPQQVLRARLPPSPPLHRQDARCAPDRQVS